ncbi:WAT1-related protein At5g64700-like [Macadamia integrifolia]|uniref:WAT1-related protein At5g64700-like n=1 Tax=Macadamia integrifolia TaxID=60698 RepID=UPI001C4E7D86|nr:WAT1-related protein At5g64700-like [Macadamia integrifolia]
MELRGIGLWFEISKPYLFLTLNELCLAVFMILIQSILSKGVNALAIVVYEHIVATIVISLLAFFLERQKRPPISVKILCYAFLLGLLQITLCQLLLTTALGFIGSSYESIGLNLQTAVIFVLAVIFGQEKFRFWSSNGQAKIWGVTSSAAGVLSTVLWTGPTVLKSTNFPSFQVATDDVIVGVILIVVGVLATCFWNILVGHVTRMYPAELSLTAMMSFFGTIQTAIVTAIVIPSSSWELQWDGGLVFVAILFGGIVITGLSYYVMTWSIHKRGPVFTSAFTPLLIVFSFLLDTIVLGDSAHLGSIVGAFLVVVGLYLILWAKADDMKKNEISDDLSVNSPLIQP